MNETGIPSASENFLNGIRDAHDKIKKSLGREIVKNRKIYGTNADQEIKDEILARKPKIMQIIIDANQNYRAEQHVSRDNIREKIIRERGELDWKEWDKRFNAENAKTYKTVEEIMIFVCDKFISEILGVYDRNPDTKLKIYTAFVLFVSNKLADTWSFLGYEILTLAPSFDGRRPLDIPLSKTAFYSVKDIAENWNKI
jgi:hypothetical protein